jgi:hypothetical protein
MNGVPGVKEDKTQHEVNDYYKIYTNKPLTLMTKPSSSGRRSPLTSRGDFGRKKNNATNSRSELNTKTVQQRA